MPLLPARDICARPSSVEAATGEVSTAARPIRTTAAATPGQLGGLALIALALMACATPPADVAGRYRQEEPTAATLEVRKAGDQYAVRLEGGGSPAAGTATAADCVIEARGALDDDLLRARFDPVETDTFSYGAAQAASEGRTVVIAFGPDVALVREADTFGYCGLAATLVGRYRKDP